MSSGSVAGPLPIEQSRPHVDSTYLELGHKNEKSNSYTPLLTSILVHPQNVTILLYFSCTPIPQDILKLTKHKRHNTAPPEGKGWLSRKF